MLEPGLESEAGTAFGVSLGPGVDGWVAGPAVVTVLENGVGLGQMSERGLGLAVGPGPDPEPGSDGGTGPEPGGEAGSGFGTVSEFGPSAEAGFETGLAADSRSGFEIKVVAEEGTEAGLWAEAGPGKRIDLWAETVPELDFEQSVVIGSMSSSGMAAEARSGPGGDSELVPGFGASAGHGRAGLEFARRFGVEAEPVSFSRR